MGSGRVKRWLSGIWFRLRPFRSDADLKEEMESHLELQAEENAASGIAGEEARRQARAKLGNAISAIENVRDQEWIAHLEGWWKDFVFGFRGLLKNPVFCITAIATLAVGIGANTAVFTLLHGLLLRGLPVKEPHRLARLGVLIATASRPTSGIPFRLWQQINNAENSFEGISAWTLNAVTLEDREGELRQYTAAFASGNAFQLFGMNARLGRLVGPFDDVRGGPPQGWPVVLGYRFWRERFGGDSAILGKPLKISGSIVTVVGVAPREFHGLWPGEDPAFYLPIQCLSVILGRDVLNSPDSFLFVAAVGRLRSGVSIEAARAELGVRGNELFRGVIPPEYQRLSELQTARLVVESARTGLPTSFARIYSTPLYLMQGLVGIVLLLCSVNVGGLMLSKIHERQREFAIRTAIGGARWRLIRQSFTESFLIAIGGAAMGAAVAWYGSPLLLRYFRDPMMYSAMSVQPDSTVFLITGGLAVVTTLLLGTIPAWRAGRSDPALLLTSRSPAARKASVAKVFVPVQVGLSLVLVMVAMLLSESLNRIRSEDPGFDVDHVTIQTPPFNRLPQRGEARLEMYQRMVDRIRQFPGVRDAAVTWYTPMTGLQAAATFRAAQEDHGSPQEFTLAYNDVGPDYFQTMNTGIVEGREFQKNERGRDVCILNQAAARFLLGTERGIGQYVRSSDKKRFPQGVSCRVIGIAANAKFGSVREPPPRTVYFPVSAQTIQEAGNLVFLINSRTKKESTDAYRAALREIAPSVPLVLFATLREQMDAALGSQRAIATLSGFFGILALLLSGLGLYGMLASNVARRTAEIGIRMALGARRNSVMGMVLRDAFQLVGLGALGGTLCLVPAIRLIKQMLYGASAFDPAILIATTGLLALVALAGALAPALRAASVDPIDALRAE